MSAHNTATLLLDLHAGDYQAALTECARRRGTDKRQNRYKHYHAVLMLLLHAAQGE